MNCIKSIAAFILLTAFIIPAGCSGKQTDNIITAAAETGTETSAEAELVPDLPEFDGGGDKFMFLTKMEGDETGRWTAEDIDVQEQNGEVVNDAVYTRNSIVEEKYNITISQAYMAMGGQYTYTMCSEITKLIMAGDSTYDVIMPTIQDAALLARDKMLYNLSTLSYINLDMPWWNQQFNNDVNIGGKAYFADGDICMTFMRAAYCVLFNKQLITDYSLENPYNIVTGGTWTIDKMTEMGAVFASDINGDGNYTDADNIGVGLLNNHIEVFYTASGLKLVTVDKDGVFTFTGGTQQSIDMFDKIFRLYETRDSVINFAEAARLSVNKGTGQVEAAAATFEERRLLFLVGTMNNVPNMRDMETDFGILPLPMSSDAQDQYYSYVQTWASGCAAICITAANTDKSSAVLEEMAYQARKILTPAYYDVSLKTKFTRDTESQTMLDLIYENRTCDLGNLFNIGSLVSGITDMVNNRKDGYASFIAGKEESIKTTLEEITALYAKQDA